MSVNTFYPKYPQGTATKLIFDAQNLNSRAVHNLASTLEDQFQKKVGFMPKGKDLFCHMVHQKNNENGELSFQDILTSEFFQSMQRSELPHEKIRRLIAPRMLQSAKEHFFIKDIKPEDEEMILNWYARFSALYLKDEEIASYTEPQGKQGEDIMELRKAIGIDLHKMVASGSLDLGDFQGMLDICNKVLDVVRQGNMSHQKEAISLAVRYLELFTKVEDIPTVVEDIVGKLASNAKEMFSDLSQKA